jgi:hypothetical protein
MKRQSVRDRALISDRIEHGRSYKEIAERHGHSTVAASHMAVSRALVRLTASMRAQASGPSAPEPDASFDTARRRGARRSSFLEGVISVPKDQESRFEELESTLGGRSYLLEAAVTPVLQVAVSVRDALITSARADDLGIRFEVTQHLTQPVDPARICFLILHPSRSIGSLSATVVRSRARTYATASVTAFIDPMVESSSELGERSEVQIIGLAAPALH